VFYNDNITSPYTVYYSDILHIIVTDDTSPWKPVNHHDNKHIMERTNMSSFLQHQVKQLVF